MSFRIIQGDCLSVLKTLPAESVHTCVTSPPYWGLRDYGTAQWEGGDAECDHAAGFCRNDGNRQDSDGFAGNRNLEGHANMGVKQFRDTCGKCGATRIDQQIGLEKTPELFVAKMVEVFREVRRVLRDDGTLWLNLGDSYASGMRSAYDDDRHKYKTARAHDMRPPTPVGLKEKDLCGIPWLVAKALRDPYYTGRIKNVEDRIWLAAMIDAEGCIFIHKRKAGQHNGQGYYRQNDSYSPGLEVANTSEAVVNRCMEIVGLGSICSQSPEQNDRRKQTIYRWSLRTTECREVIREVYPHLVAKQHQARLLIGCPSSGDDAERAHAGLIALHNGLECDMDLPEPKSMYEPGWYLRSDIIWKKPNPMPESVTDRPTKSHEYIFLLTKSPRYYYDAEAVKEKASEKTVTPVANTAPKQDATPAGQGIRHNSTFKTFYRPSERNKRSVWTVATAPFSGAHFATFPPKLIEPCILAGTSEQGCCGECGAPWERVVERGELQHTSSCGNTSPHKKGKSLVHGSSMAANMHASGIIPGHQYEIKTLGWRPTCTCKECGSGCSRCSGEYCDRHFADPCECDVDARHALPMRNPCTVLDPFAGAGTTGLVARRLGRSFIGIELNPEYLNMAENRIVDDAPLFNTPTSEEANAQDHP